MGLCGCKSYLIHSVCKISHRTDCWGKKMDLKAAFILGDVHHNSSISRYLCSYSPNCFNTFYFHPYFSFSLSVSEFLFFSFLCLRILPTDYCNKKRNSKTELHHSELVWICSDGKVWKWIENMGVRRVGLAGECLLLTPSGDVFWRPVGDMRVCKCLNVNSACIKCEVVRLCRKLKPDIWPVNFTLLWRELEEEEEAVRRPWSW